MKCLIRCDFPVYNYFFFSMPIIIEMCSWPLVEGELFERAHYLLSMNIIYGVNALHLIIPSSFLTSFLEVSDGELLSGVCVPNLLRSSHITVYRCGPF